MAHSQQQHQCWLLPQLLLLALWQLQPMALCLQT
jgi:hypothetical protein